MHAYSQLQINCFLIILMSIFKMMRLILKSSFFWASCSLNRFGDVNALVKREISNDTFCAIPLMDYLESTSNLQQIQQHKVSI